MEGSSTPPPAGWYPDPEDEALQRFWDGTRWTSSRMPRMEAVPVEGTPPAEPEPRSLEAGEQPPRYASDARAGDADGRQGPLPPAAWYADPENATGMRYWDGTRWTEHRTNYRADPATEARSSEGMVAAGYVLSFLIPIVGVVLGIILIRRKSTHGPWVLGLSLLFILVFLVVNLNGSGT